MNKRQAPDTQKITTFSLKILFNSTQRQELTTVSHRVISPAVTEHLKMDAINERCPLIFINKVSRTENLCTID